MTNEELIQSIQDHIDSGVGEYEGYGLTLDECRQVIKALELQSCGDSISRTDLITAMHLIMDDAKIGDYDEDYESLDDIKEQYIEIVKGMVSVKPEMKWIPVSEKHPNSYEYILATMISPVTQLPFVSKLYTGENAKEKIEESKVIAWMGLPKPYKEKK